MPTPAAKPQVAQHTASSGWGLFDIILNVFLSFGYANSNCATNQVYVHLKHCQRPHSSLPNPSAAGSTTQQTCMQCSSGFAIAATEETSAFKK